MKTIAYYISDYGYGHASRSIAIIRELLKNPKVEIVVCHSFALSFLKESLGTSRLKYRCLKTDIGYFLEKDSIQPDRTHLFNEYKRFVADWDCHIQQELEFLRDSNVDLVISDISPLPFEAAEQLGIPSVGLSNFTWYTAYQGLINDNELVVFKEAYQKMTYFYCLAGGKEEWVVKTNHFGYFSREYDSNEVNRIRRLINPHGDKSIVFLGLGMKIEVESLEQLPIWNSPNCEFIVSSNVHVNLPNVYQIPRDYLESQNFIAASDLVISKAGWGIIGEAINAKVPLLILNRPSMTEDQNTIKYLKDHQLCTTIDWDAFQTYKINQSMINDLRSMYTDNEKFQNEAEKLAADLLEIVGGGSRQ